ncbi:hypothetical protein CTAYLR_002312 [Chrysophaeum taylorii]|uniref:VTT domain-containing protein n=1 Tax=Chrysophaeum taylorii TaxID=2483200 RepID=A0AAD7XU47_9STRA|nr:hypothetical protein CTAYLR_002312 [Chrysophaeum taylorii]
MWPVVLALLSVPSSSLLQVAPLGRPNQRRGVHRRLSLNEAFDAVEELVLRGGPGAAYLAVCFFDSVPLLPTQPITIATGAAFGLGPGLAIVVSGQATAATLCFAAGRTILGPDRVREIFGAKITSIASQFATGSGEDSFATTFKSVVLLRQSPVVPFSVGNYVLGAATDAPIPALLAGTVVGCLPLNALYTTTGAVVRGGAKAFVDNVGIDLGRAEEFLGVVGVAATVGVIYLFVKAFRQLDAAD